MSRTQLNIEFMKKVRDRIKEVGPEHCDMGSFIEAGVEGKISGRGRLDCGTTACIAGHTLAVKNGIFSEDDMDNDADYVQEAMEALGLPNDNLFFSWLWPSKYDDNPQASDWQRMLRILDDLISGKLDPVSL